MNKLNIILTSYNRPRLIQMAIDSLLAQEDDRWHCYLQDDNSNDETLKVIRKYENDDHFTIGTHETTAKDRQETTRYSVLINEILPGLRDGAVGMMCDNVTYENKLVGTILNWLGRRPEAICGYVTQTRDMYHQYGENDAGEYMGWASEFGHWATTPFRPGKAIASPYGNLDQSQVFYRRPIDLKWSENHDVVKFGDAEYFIRIVGRYGPIECITPEILSCEHLLYERIHVR